MKRKPRFKIRSGREIGSPASSKTTGEGIVLVAGSLQELVDFNLIARAHEAASGIKTNVTIDDPRLPDILQTLDFFDDEEVEAFTQNRRTEDLQKIFARFEGLCGRSYASSTYEGHPEATRIFIVEGVAAGPIRDRVTQELARKEKVGMIHVRQSEPFDGKSFVEKVPGSVQEALVVDTGTLYFQVLNALHEGMTNGWSWYTVFPKLIKIKGNEPVAEAPATLRARLEGFDGARNLDLQKLLLTVLSEWLFGQRIPGEGGISYIRLSPEPIRRSDPPQESQIVLSQSDAVEAERLAALSGVEAQAATVLATSFLKQALDAFSTIDVLPSREVVFEKWRSALEGHFRPWGPFFVRGNLAACDRAWKGEAAPASISKKSEVSEIQTPFVPGFDFQTAIILPDFESDRLSDTFPDSSAGAIVLPTIRERDLRTETLAIYQSSSGPEPASFGFKRILERIRSLKKTFGRPLLARLSAQTLETWLDDAVELQEAGVDALEIFFNAAEEEDGQDGVTILRRLKTALRIPVLFALPFYEGDVLKAVADLKDAGADGCILFHEATVRDFDPQTSLWREISTPPGDLHRLRVLEWISKLSSKLPSKFSGDCGLPLIAHGGFRTEEDVRKALALGAAWVQREPSR